jgi:hypothetical protein
MTLDIIITGQDGEHLGLKHSGIFPKGEAKSLPSCCLNTPAPVPPHPKPVCKTDFFLDAGGVPVPEIQSSLVSTTTLYLHSKLFTGFFTSTAEEAPQGPQSRWYELCASPRYP